MKKIFCFIIICNLILIFNSCREYEFVNDNIDEKEEYFKRLSKMVDERFFDYNYISAFNTTLEEIHSKNDNYKGNVDLHLKSASELYSPFIKEIRQFYRDHTDIWKNIEKKYGFPMWDRLLEFEWENEKLAVIPVAKTSSTYTEAIIYVLKSKNGNLKFHTAVRGKFNSYPNKTLKENGKKKPDKEFVISQFLLFDTNIFEYHDCNLIGLYKNTIRNNNLKSTSEYCLAVVTFNVTDYYYDVHVDGELIKREYNFSRYEYDVDYYCVDNIVNTESSSGGGGGETNDGGQKTWYPGSVKPCIGDPVIGATIAASKNSGILGGTFGMTRTNGTQLHNGLDIYAEVGTPLYAMYDSIITEVDYSNANGNYYRMRCEIGTETYEITMIHMQNIYVKEGDRVIQGANIGTSGRTGNASDINEVPNPHVHISMRKRNSNGTWPDGFEINDFVNPLPFLSTTFDAFWNPNPCVDGSELINE